ncbi:DUF3239 domain-containing protein [Corynebacterium terpenotabidum]|uniref:DUF3239 domain-containing protein n=1 Tax=Corynebacterium terpenotabidum Y-11 TaxID=1200352 RepID=S4XF15_9CORY|nr:DUF3239 domain-containing protein [Corynebacterium terpenotabidum]AGP30205.1 hypothetical protein A606_02760 [Corynebacterium terpenotabidum Y-11]
MSNFNFTVDESFARTHNEFFRDAKRFQWSAGILGLIFLVATVVLVLIGTGLTVTIAVACGIMALLCFVMVPVLPRQLGSPQSYYDNYDLVPTVVAKVNPRDVVLLALVDTAVPETGEAPTPALAVRTVTSVPGIRREVGERVPSMAVTGMRTTRNRNHWEEISPMPVAWGTKDRAVIASAEKTISDRQWKKVEALVDRVDEVSATRRRLLEL